jgi:hypothetical protein
MKFIVRGLAAALWLLVIVASVYAEMSVTLKKSFITTYMERATIDVAFTVDAAHEHPNPGSSDGDMHVAGHCAEVGLPMVAELMNAKDKTATQDVIHTAESHHTSLTLSGAWRIWWEHPQSGANQSQLTSNTLHGPATNPDHAFEIHPLTVVAEADVRDTFHKIPGYTPTSATKAFKHYESRTCTIVPQGDGVTITTSKALYNYARFKIKLASGAVTMSDGRWYYADVYTLTGHTPIAQDIPMVFVQDSPPETVVRTKHVGDEMKVLGIPRVNLRTVDYVADHFQPGEEDSVWYLPYEMIIVATY